MRLICLAVLLSLNVTTPTSAQTYNLMDYWLNKSGECMAVDEGDPGSFIRNHRSLTKIGCQYPGRPVSEVYFMEKGGWGTETYIVDGGYLVLVTESGPPILCGSGAGATYRRFVQRVTGMVGVNHLKMQFTVFQSWLPPPQTLECGYSCRSFDFTVPLDFGPQDRTEQAMVGPVSGFLYDCRPERLCRGGLPYPVEMIVKRDTWGSGAVQEEYYYGRWRDPLNGNAWTPLGFLQWIEKTRQPDGTYRKTNGAKLDKLVTCSLRASCSSCGM